MAIRIQLRIGWLWLLLAGGALAAGVQPDIRFAGVVTDSQGTMFCLEDQATGGWNWLPVGGRFFDYTIKAYDPATQTLTLARNAQECSLRLASSRVLESPRNPAPGEVQEIQDNLQLFRLAAAAYFRETRNRYATYEELFGADKILPDLAKVAGEDYRSLTLMKGETHVLSVVTNTGVKISN